MRTFVAVILVTSLLAGCREVDDTEQRQISELSRMVHEARSANARLREECRQLREENGQLKKELEHVKNTYNLSKAAHGPEQDKSSGIYDEVFP